MPGHYVRVAPAESLLDEEALQSDLPIKNRAQDAGVPAEEQVATDFLQLVRFALRGADDSMIRATVQVTDGLLEVDTPAGPVWHRYNGDGYGEHDDGTPFDGTGVGRAWPLLTGERGHYELCAGRSPRPYLEAMADMASATYMLPEQVWDAAPIAARDLKRGRPSGSAMPLAWAHAEFLKLSLSERLGRPFDCPRSVQERYSGRLPTPRVSVWCEQAPMRDFFVGTDVRIYLHAPAKIVWRTESASAWRETPTRPGGLGLHAATLATRELSSGRRVQLRIVRDGADDGARDFTLEARVLG